MYLVLSKQELYLKCKLKCDWRQECMNKLRVNKTKTNSRPIIFTVWKLSAVSWGPIWHYQFLKGSRVSHQCVQYQWFSRNASEIAYSSVVQILYEIWYMSTNTGLIFALTIYRRACGGILLDQTPGICSQSCWFIYAAEFIRSSGLLFGDCVRCKYNVTNPKLPHSTIIPLPEITLCLFLYRLLLLRQHRSQNKLHL